MLFGDSRSGRSVYNGELCMCHDSPASWSRLACRQKAGANLGRPHGPVKSPYLNTAYLRRYIVVYIHESATEVPNPSWIDTFLRNMRKTYKSYPANNDTPYLLRSHHTRVAWDDSFPVKREKCRTMRQSTRELEIVSGWKSEKRSRISPSRPSEKSSAGQWTSPRES